MRSSLVMTNSTDDEKVKKPNEPVRKRFQRQILDDFKETLESFCQAVLPNGSRSGNKWICGDLAGGEGKSCCIFFDTGGFCDANPAAEYPKGNVFDLWMALYPQLTDKNKVYAAMEKWLEAGELPDGSKGTATRSKLETLEGVVISPQNPQERKFATMIKASKERLERINNYGQIRKWYWPAHLPRNLRPSGPTWWKDPSGDPPEEYDGNLYISEQGPRPTEEEIEAEIVRQRAYVENEIRQLRSEFFTARWIRVVEETIAQREEAAAFLAEYRGLSKEVFTYLINAGYIALYASTRVSCLNGQKWDTIEIAFPVVREVQWATWPCDLEMLGMHCKWIKNKEEGGWRYEPKGISSEPLIIGDLHTAETVFIAESTWDIIAAIDLSEAYDSSEWAAIATRGAANAARLEVEGIRADATLIALMQNDKANQLWLSSLPREIYVRLRLWTPPERIKDLNDWMQQNTREEICQALNIL
jgi:hypothetical protein